MKTEDPKNIEPQDDSRENSQEKNQDLKKDVNPENEEKSRQTTRHTQKFDVTDRVTVDDSVNVSVGVRVENTVEKTVETPHAGKAEELLREMKAEEEEKGFLADFRRRIRAVKTTRWIRFAIVSLLLCGFVIWIGNPWIALVWLLLIDIYLTCYIPWSWWKKEKGPVRSIMAWVDAIIYALVLVYIIFAFVGQNYKIPSSSLEKSLLVGDYLWVSKVVYGPRVPQTPLHFPLAQHTMPLTGGKSYIENPQLPYHRLPGLRSIERGDIVVFNYPQGDTLITASPNEDFYMICDRLRKQGIANPKEFIAQNPQKFGQIITRPVDRRENYVKRCVGLPGEWLEIRNDTIFINDAAIEDADNVQFNYVIPVSAAIPLEQWQEIGVRMEDHGEVPISVDFIPFKFYDVPLTSEARKVVETWPQVNGELVREGRSGFFDMGGVFPQHDAYNWKRTDMSKFWIPKRGVTLKLTLNNLPLYRRCVAVYEGNVLQVKDGEIYINGEKNPYYTFKYDYYWMMGDNRDRSLDSRYWGFVPEDHIVGSPMLVLTSIDEERPIFDANKIRWSRTFSNPNPDKSSGAKKGWK